MDITTGMGGLNVSGGRGSTDARGTPAPDVKKKCQYWRGGNCKEHGPGARKKFKPAFKKTVSPGGSVTKKYYQKTYYECDVAPGGGVD